MKNLRPNYNLIYNDIINEKYPEKKEKCFYLLGKNELSNLDIIKINKIIFGENNASNYRHRSYDESTICEILNYQKNNRLNNTEVASHFKISRNTITKWKKITSK